MLYKCERIQKNNEPPALCEQLHMDTKELDGETLENKTIFLFLTMIFICLLN